MVWKVILSLIVLVLALVFVGLNLDNRTDISVGFHKWTGVPVFLAMFFSFAFGALVIVPFLVRARFRKKPDARKPAEQSALPGAEKGGPAGGAGNPPGDPGRKS